MKFIDQMVLTMSFFIMLKRKYIILFCKKRILF